MEQTEQTLKDSRSEQKIGWEILGQKVTASHRNAEKIATFDIKLKTNIICSIWNLHIPL